MIDDYEYLYPQYPTENVFPFEPSTHHKKYKVAKNRPTRIYCDGIYDLFHYGHARSLQQAKNLFPNVFLIVGICSDTTTHKYKGKTVYSDKERYETVKHCKYVDKIIEDAPWVVTDEFIKKHNIDFIAHDDIPFMHNGVDVYQIYKDKNVFVPTKRTLGVSTSGLITRIVKDYDEFVWRNLERGVSAKELNVSIFDEKMFKMKKRMKEVKRKAKDEIQDMRDEIRVAMNFWEEMGKEFVKKFENENVWGKIKSVLGKKGKDDTLKNGGKDLESKSSTNKGNANDGTFGMGTTSTGNVIDGDVTVNQGNVIDGNGTANKGNAVDGAGTFDMGNVNKSNVIDGDITVKMGTTSTSTTYSDGTTFISNATNNTTSNAINATTNTSDTFVHDNKNNKRKKSQKNKRKKNK